jgi:hypothetical protein
MKRPRLLFLAFLLPAAARASTCAARPPNVVQDQLRARLQKFFITYADPQYDFTQGGRSKAPAAPCEPYQPLSPLPLWTSLAERKPLNIDLHDRR